MSELHAVDDGPTWPAADVEATARDVSTLPPGAFGHRSLMWWGTAGIMVIEGTAFALAVGAYLYMQSRSAAWPPDGVAPPDLLWGGLTTLVLIVSAVPNHLAERAAERIDRAGVLRWMLVALALGVLFNVCRAFEFARLNVSWSRDAYGSLVWLLLGLHTTHIVTDVLDTAVLTAVMARREVEEHRYVDVAENALYWDFVVLAWLPIYGVIYWAPRLGG